MMNAYKIETILHQDGTLTLRGLPFRAGEAVEIIILEKFKERERDLTQQPSQQKLTHLKGALLRYDEPFEPAVSQGDWEVFQ
ncbi:MAG: hypothetical protein SW833_22115 [Cyanobacteriota bacterium]|nr:hypothetical protein [Cyanobacteriota bacterium]